MINHLKIKSIRKLKNLSGKRVLVRCDFNVSIKGKKVMNDFKIIQSLPTIRFLRAKGAKVILATHLGRPQGKKNDKLKLEPVCVRLAKLLGVKVACVDDCVGKKAQLAIAKMKNEDVVILDNLRFYQSELNNDKKFAKALASLADIYVNDALAVSHRQHASLAAIKNYLPAYAGLLLEKEVTNLYQILRPKKPLVVIIGGIKIETKVPVIKNLKRKADVILIGGMISPDFLAAQKLSTGRYRVTPEKKRLAKKILSRKVVIPIDFVTTTQKDGSGDITVYAADSLPKNVWQFDIGPQTISLYARYIKQASTIVWNGPMGKFEDEHFKHGTLSVARLVASVSYGKAFGVVGGGETVAALKQTEMLGYVDWVSTSGGAMLSFLAGEKLPGLKGIVR